MEQRCCGDCFWFRPTAVEEWAAPVKVGKCTFGPAPQALDGNRTMSANGGRQCETFVPSVEVLDGRE